MKTEPIATARRDFELGVLTAFELFDLGMHGIQLSLVSTKGEYTLSKARSTEPRLFKTFDAAIAIAREIGFQAVVVAGR